MSSATESGKAAAPLMQKSDAWGALDLIGTWSAVFIAFSLAYFMGNPLVYAIVFCIISGLQHRLINLQHEAWHRSCFRNKRLNDFVGRWFYACPVGMAFEYEKRKHLLHHKLVGLPEDPDYGPAYSNLSRETPSAIVRFFLFRLCGSMLFQTLYSVVLKGRARIATEGESRGGGGGDPSVVGEYVRVAISQMVLLLLCTVLFSWKFYFLIWLLPLVTLTTFVVSFRNFVEHCHPEDGCSIDERLYNFSPNWMERFFFASCSFDQHALHHRYPAVPHYRLRSLRERLVDESSPALDGQRSGYVSSFIEHLRIVGENQTPREEEAEAKAESSSEESKQTSPVSK